jgi:hypothetical protein
LKYEKLQINTFKHKEYFSKNYTYFRKIHLYTNGILVIITHIQKINYYSNNFFLNKPKWRYIYKQTKESHRSPKHKVCQEEPHQGYKGVKTKGKKSKYKISRCPNKAMGSTTRHDNWTQESHW